MTGPLDEVAQDQRHLGPTHSTGRPVSCRSLLVGSPPVLNPGRAVSGGIIPTLLNISYMIDPVLHPKNPFAPTLHFNYRYFETDAPKDAPGAPRQWWFGGGTDFTPSYIFEEDVKHFHSIQKAACDKFDPTFYLRFKKWCDENFYVTVRCTTFGLKTGGRIESILVSLPLTSRWEYDHVAEEGSEEWKLLDACINPKEWISE
ncbi:hypothetical protein MLD38_026591 [Melastoma candidum]|uniref:Uncharacterized protein n=1 Tax=Melastoma candidum TaxID=119954 RepID=A0ACB9NZ37_9MYRT|nr:hypothetical protein MLD38_026591 [Melastoma candidum]